MLGIYVLSMPIAYLLKRKSAMRAIIVFCYAPTTISVLLLLNSLISFNPQTEVYSYKHYQYWARGKNGTEELVTSTYIILENNKYENYYGIRVFQDYQQMTASNCITYTFKTGIFGIRVMKDYKFACAGDKEPVTKDANLQKVLDAIKKLKNN